MLNTVLLRSAAAALLTAGAALAASPALAAYDGTHCKAPGNCWEPQPGYPDQLAGSKYDPHHDPAELAKQQTSEDEMAARNKLRVENFKKTGKFEYDVDKINNQK